MASGSVIEQQVSKAAEDFTGTVSCTHASMKQIGATDIDYSLPTGYTGIVAGCSGETDLTTTPTTTIVLFSMADSNNMVGIRNNASATDYTRNVCLYATHVKSRYIDDQR